MAAREGGAPQYRLSVARLDADGRPARWAARVEGLPGCEAEGDTPAAAVAAAEAAAAERLDGAGLASSGKLLLRMPRTLHAELAARADEGGQSLNQLIVGALADAVADVPAPAAPAGAPAARRIPTALRVVLAANAAVVVLAVVVALLILTGAWHAG